MKTLYFLIPLIALFCSCSDDCPDLSSKTVLVKKQLDFFSKGDIPSFLNGCTTDCIFDLTGNQILNPGRVYLGTQGFMDFLGDLSSKGIPTLVTAKEFLESEAGVTVNGEVQFTDLATNKSCKVNFIQLWKFAGDKVSFLKEDHDNRVCN